MNRTIGAFLKNARTCSNLQHINKVNNQRAEIKREKGAFGVSSRNRPLTTEGLAAADDSCFSWHGRSFFRVRIPEKGNCCVSSVNRLLPLTTVRENAVNWMSFRICTMTDEVPKIDKMVGCGGLKAFKKR